MQPSLRFTEAQLSSFDTLKRGMRAFAHMAVAASAVSVAQVVARSVIMGTLQVRQRQPQGKKERTTRYGTSPWTPPSPQRCTPAPRSLGLWAFSLVLRFEAVCKCIISALLGPLCTSA